MENDVQGFIGFTLWVFLLGVFAGFGLTLAGLRFL